MTNALVGSLGLPATACAGSDLPPLFRAQSSHRLTHGRSGYFDNPNLLRVRRPKDSSAQLHDVAGSWMLERFGINYRNLALFCTGNKEIAVGYAALPGMTPIRIWPIGEYSICFSKNCLDLYGHFQFRPNITDDEIRNSLDALEFQEFKNTGIQEAVASQCEVMLFARKFGYCKI